MSKGKDNPIQDAIRLYEDKNRALKLPSDEEICNQLILKQGNINATAKALETTSRYINSRIKDNPSVNESLALSRAIVTQGIFSDLVNAVSTGFLEYREIQPDGTYKIDKKRIEVGTRLFHMTKLVDITKVHIGIVKKEVPQQVNNTVNFITLSNNQLETIDYILENPEKIQ